MAAAAIFSTPSWIYVKRRRIEKRSQTVSCPVLNPAQNSMPCLLLLWLSGSGPLHPSLRLGESQVQPEQGTNFGSRQVDTPEGKYRALYL